MSLAELDHTLDDVENSRLLTIDERPDEPIPATRSMRIRASRWQAKSPGMIILLVAVIKFCIVVSGMMIMLPVYRLIEDAICHVHYEDDSLDMIEEMKCKVDEVQSRLAVLLGWLGTSSSIIGFIVALPYGTLADRIGRKPTVIIAYSGIAVSFLFAPLLMGTFARAVRRHPYLLMSGQLFQFLGGSVVVLFATLYAIAADVSDDKTKASNFLHLSFGATLGGLLGPLLAGLLMNRYGPWVPIYVVICITPFVFGLFLVIPETLNVDEKVKNRTASAKMSIKAHVRGGVRDLRLCLDLLKNKNIPLILVTFLSQNARFAAYTGTLAQYLSKHFGWKIAETSILLSPLGVLNLLVLAGLPFLARYLTSPRIGFTNFRKDLFLTRVSTVLLIAGALIEGVSHNIYLFLFGLFIGTFGAADNPLARATITHYVEPEYTSRLYALISMAEVVGSLFAGPMLAFCFNFGLRHKGFWMGMPWFYMALVCFLCWLGLVFVRPPPSKNNPPEPVYRDDDVDDETSSAVED